jgi:hypothetical protein
VKPIKRESVEIVTFNNSLPDLPSLIEFGDGDLEAVNGGQMLCGNLVSCGTYCTPINRPEQI